MDKAMTGLEDTDNNCIAIHFPLWMRIIAGICTAFGIFVFTAIALTGWDTRSDFGAGLGVALGFLFFGLPFLSHTVKVTFDKALGNITIRKCFWYLPYRTRCISKKEVQSAITTISEGGSAGPYATVPDTYGVSIRLMGKKPIKIGSVDRKNAHYLTDKINRFVRFE